ncbi:MAG: amino acid permease, partial [Mycoplasmataceae bacterium]|nr:amino acid permease [Mycoplasmataceae bacterium]
MTQVGKTKREYGLLTMIATIIGIVIGSGIFIKNAGLIETTQSAILSTIGWLIGGLVVIAMLIAFIEISSITKKKNEQGTFSSWSKYLWSDKMSKYVGVYFTFLYFPLVLGEETIFAANELVGIFDNISLFWMFAITTFLTFVILIAAFMINSFSQKPGQRIVSAGTMIKIIPLVSLVLLAVLIFFGVVIQNGDGAPVTTNSIFDPNANINLGLHDDESNFLQVLLILPAILFAFDGFLFANSLSTETKKPSTYKTAAIIAITIITLVYILFSLSSYMLADTTLNEDGIMVSDNFGIQPIFIHIFGESLGKLIGTFIEITIFISIITATFAYSITSMWTLSDYSNINEIRDINGTLIRRNSAGVPTMAGIKMLTFALIAIVVIRGCDLINILGILWLVDDGTNIVNNNNNVDMNSYTSDMTTIMNFSFYTLIIIGGVKNRFTKEVETEKVRGFFIFSAIATIIIAFAVLDLAGTVLIGSYNAIDALFNSQN